MSSETPDRATVNLVFGAELPQESSDERDYEAPAEMGERDRWLRDNVPPHHI